MSRFLLILWTAVGCAQAPETSSVDDGLGTAASNLSNTAALSTLAYNFGKNVALDGRGQVHVVWTEGDPASAAVAYKRSPDNGVTWSSTGTFGTSPVTGGVRVAAAGDNIYLVWHGLYEGYVRIYLIRSTDAGATFSAPVPISDAGIGAEYPTIAASGSEVHVAWSDNRSKLVVGVADTHAEIYVRNSSDRGATFGPTVPVSVPDHHSSWTPAIAAQAGIVHVAWTDERWDTIDCADINDSTNCHEEEYYRRSLDNGATWGPEVRLTSDAGTPQSSWAPSIVVASSYVHLAYFDFRTGVARVYYQRSVDTGATWLAQAAGEQLLSDPSYTDASARPVLAALGAEVRLVFWRQGATAADVYFAGSSMAGAAGTWMTPLPMTANIGHTTVSALQPSVALGPDGSNHVIWMDSRDGNTEIYYQRIN